MPAKNEKPAEKVTAHTIEEEAAEVRVLNIAGELDDLNINIDELSGLEDGEAAADGRPMGIVTEEMAGTILATPFEVAAAFLGKHWQLSAGEIELMSPPAARVFSDLFGRYASQYPDAYMLGFALCTAVGVRAAQTIYKRKAEESKASGEVKSSQGDPQAFMAVPDIKAARNEGK